MLKVLKLFYLIIFLHSLVAFAQSNRQTCNKSFQSQNKYLKKQVSTEFEIYSNEDISISHRKIEKIMEADGAIKIAEEANAVKDTLFSDYMEIEKSQRFNFLNNKLRSINNRPISVIHEVDGTITYFLPLSKSKNDDYKIVVSKSDNVQLRSFDNGDALLFYRNTGEYHYYKLSNKSNGQNFEILKYTDTELRTNKLYDMQLLSDGNLLALSASNLYYMKVSGEIISKISIQELVLDQVTDLLSMKIRQYENGDIIIHSDKYIRIPLLAIEESSLKLKHIFELKEEEVAYLQSNNSIYISPEGYYFMVLGNSKNKTKIKVWENHNI